MFPGQLWFCWEAMGKISNRHSCKRVLLIFLGVCAILLASTGSAQATTCEPDALSSELVESVAEEWQVNLAADREHVPLCDVETEECDVEDNKDAPLPTQSSKQVRPLAVEIAEDPFLILPNPSLHELIVRNGERSPGHTLDIFRPPRGL
jgi:hypothetical protein